MVTPRRRFDYFFAPPEPYYVGNFRLASKLLAAIGLQYLAREVTLVATPQSLSRLLALSYHPALRANVRSLRISCFMYALPGNFMQVAACLGERPVSSPKFSMTLSAHYAYISLCHGQEKLVQSENYWASLKMILLSLPNLRSVKIFDGAIRETIPRDMALYRAVDYEEGCFFTYSGNWTLQNEFASRTLNHVLGTIEDITSQQANRDFALDYAYASYGISENKLGSWLGALKSLKRLKLTQTRRDEQSGYGSTQDYSDWHGEVSKYDLAAFVAAAENLEELDICMTSLNISPTKLFGTKAHWPYLQKLTLIQATLDAEHILGFFRRHGRTLKVLDLSWSHLKHTLDGIGWVHLFERAQHESLFNLHSLRLCHISGLNSSLYFKSWSELCPNIVPPDRAL